jgi:hypothetical protein
MLLHGLKKSLGEAVFTPPIEETSPDHPCSLVSQENTVFPIIQSVAKKPCACRKKSYDAGDAKPLFNERSV